MKKEDLKKLISQIKKYDLVKCFSSPDNFEKWLSNLSEKQIKNINSISIEPENIIFPKKLLIDENLLNCDDYLKRIKLMAKIKIDDRHLDIYERMCDISFLESKNYYDDMESLGNTDIANYDGLRIIDNYTFINSWHHKEDLELIINAKDVEGKYDYLVASSLANVASNWDSISSKYHNEDMKLIATAGSSCLQDYGYMYEYGLNHLATNEISLSDKYHLENMKILAKAPLSQRLLYKLMTDMKIINGKYYREEVKALENAKSITKALAIYCHIVNPKELDYYELKNLHIVDFNDSYYYLRQRRNCIDGNTLPNYLENLELLNNICDEYVLYIESLLTDKTLINSEYYKYYLDLLIKTKDKDIFMDLYELIIDEVFINSEYQKHDIDLISKAMDYQKRELLIRAATDSYSVKSENHKFDMEYILKLDIDNLSEEQMKKICQYLFVGKYINDKDHIADLELLYVGKPIIKTDLVLEYINDLECKIHTSEDDLVFDNGSIEKIEVENKEIKVLSKIKKWFRK